MAHNIIALNNQTYLHWGTANKKVVISSHGAINYRWAAIPKTSVDLYFAAKGNRSTHGKVSSIRFMNTNDFIYEPAGTSGIDEHYLTWYDQDTESEIEECLANGFDVVTIKPNFTSRLSTVLSKLGTYDEIYGLFCRVPQGKKRVKVLP